MPSSAMTTAPIPNRQNYREKKLAAIDGLTTLELTAHIVAAYVVKNPVPAARLPDLIASVSVSVRSLGESQPQAELAPKPAVNPKKSVFPDYIISLEDGSKFKSLKRPLMIRYGMSPDEYRAKWGLPKDYPMVAPNYAARRSEMAKKMGLGRKPGQKVPRRRN